MEYWLDLKNKLSLKSKLALRSNNILLFIILCLFLMGCHSEQETLEEDVEMAEVETYTVNEEENNVIEENALDETESNMIEDPQAFDKTVSQKENFADEYSYIDYDYVEQYHEILFHNITTSPKDDYDDTVLAEYLKKDIEKDKKLLEAASGEETPLTIKYHLFDFNDDGLEDYLVCYHAPYYCGTGGNSVVIFIQESDASLSRVFSITMRLHEYAWPNEHSPMAILDEKDDGYYAFVLVGNNHIVRYNKERGRYVF